MEAPAADSALVIGSQKTQDAIHVGLSWTEGLGKYKLSKVITIAPRFIIKNNLDRQISFREHRLSPRDGSTVDIGQKAPLLFMRSDSQKLLTIALAGLDAQWYAHAFCSKTMILTVTLQIGHRRSVLRTSARCISVYGIVGVEIRYN